MRIITLAAALAVAVCSHAAVVLPIDLHHPRWPAGRVPLQFSDDFKPTERARVVGAIARFGPLVAAYSVDQCDGPCLRVRRHPDPRGACSSDVGAEQIAGMTLSDACLLDRDTLAHEAGHALGLGHPHQAPDRCRWIGWVDYDAIAWVGLRQYRVRAMSALSPASEPDSVMTYTSADWSLGPPTHGGRWGDGVTRHDVAAIAAIYTSRVTDPVPDLPVVSAYQDAGDWIVDVADRFAEAADGSGRVECGAEYDWSPIADLPGWLWTARGWSLRVDQPAVDRWSAGGRFVHVRSLSGRPLESVYGRDGRVAVLRVL